MNEFRSDRSKKQGLDVMAYKWYFLAAICLSICIILLYREEVFGPTVSCRKGHRIPELRIFYPPPTESSNRLTTILAQSNIKSYRDSENRIDRYFLCSNDSLSIKLRNLDKIEIKTMDREQPHTRTRWWTKYTLGESPLNPFWGDVNTILQRCETFSWIPETNACDSPQSIDVSKKVKKTRIKLALLDPKLRRPTEQCFGSSLQNQAMTVEYGLVEIILYTWDGPKTIGRYNTIGLEDGTEKAMDCLLQELETYFPQSGITGAYTYFLNVVVSNYNRSH